jgi:hypothetical protein
MSSSDEIRRQLAAMRFALRRDARDAAVDARTLVDWRHHFRRHPWLYCSGAAVIGYLVVPRRPPPPQLQSASYRTAAPVEQRVGAASVHSENLAASLVKAAVATAATALVKRAITHLVDLGRTHFEESMAARREADMDQTESGSTP